MGSHLLPFVRGGCTLILFCASEMGELRGGGANIQESFQAITLSMVIISYKVKI